MARHDPPILSQAADSRSDGALGTDGTPSPSAATARVETGRPFRVAVVIPLGLDRGIGVDCIRGWALEQDLPRERYQLLLGAPPDLDAKKREQIQRMLAPWDVMVALHDSHDMRLVEHAAGRADADLLLFSESHCIPQPDAVSYLVEQIDGHPDWAALSAPTRALADNPLAEIERDVYSRDIHGKLSHDWLRVLDQCFLIRREAYDLTGGFRGAYGHFAEWLLAAAMRLRGLRIGVAERAVVSHKYIGDYDELERFTTDFAYGQIKYLHECRHEPAASLFPAIPESIDFLARTPQQRQRLARQAREDAARVLATARKKGWSAEKGLMRAHQSWVERLGAQADSFAAHGLGQARADARRARETLAGAIAQGAPRESRAGFIEWFACLVRQGRFAYLADLERAGDRPTAEAASNFPRSETWTPDAAHSYAQVLDAHDVESTDYGTIRWTLPMLQVHLPLHPGKQRISLEWVAARPLHSSELIAIRFDGRVLAAHERRLAPTQLIIDVPIPRTGWYELSVSVYPFKGHDDGRLLGLPLKRIVWLSDDRPGATGKTTRPPPRYFLHVPKCGGTTVTTHLSNAFRSDQIFSPYGGAFLAPAFDVHPRRDDPVDLYSGHFRWRVPEATAGKGARISTVLRHPLERLLSRFHYDRQLGRVHPGLDFESWARTSATFQTTMVGHLVSCPEAMDATGGQAIARAAGSLLEQAIANLARCAVVGLVEQMEDTINLLAMEMGFLPPRRLGRYNATRSRHPLESLGPVVVADLTRWFSADLALYEEAKRLFAAQRAARYGDLLGRDQLGSAQLGPGQECHTQAARDRLRQLYLDRLRRAVPPAPAGHRLEWTPDDLFHGENLHQREHDGRSALRWTGPETETCFVLPIDPAREWDLEVRMHPATPRGHVEALRLMQGETEVQVETVVRGGDYLLRGKLMPMGATNTPLAALRLVAPVVQETSGFRPIGVALTGMSATCAR